ncbi:hypothetical protein [Chryseobacterium vrystaatense]|uniref:Lipoprotein n=1 Tax=Chryseobacterium vrystaatense TaxID=307480 RepID=A0A1M4ZEQ7_9FLAO|nr:hypothetical protein [Chryseobacterium vrystaatense]SHF16481.1 hypothetical protein SAMN02787073_1576 [Chryseobacterium vrystaatense]
MKTKVIFLAAAASVLLYSCSTDRNEDEVVKPVPVAKVEVKPKKINNRGGENSKVGDSLMASPPSSSPSGGIIIKPIDPDPVDGGDPKDVPPRR